MTKFGSMIILWIAFIAEVVVVFNRDTGVIPDGLYWLFGYVIFVIILVATSVFRISYSEDINDFMLVLLNDLPLEHIYMASSIEVLPEPFGP